MSIALLALLTVPFAPRDAALPACTTGADCVEQGRKLVAADGKPSSWASARELFRLACERGEGEGCIYQEAFAPRGLAGDPGGAQVRKSCDQGAAAGCSDLGKLFELRNGRPSALQAYQRGCDGGDAAGCELLGTGILLGRFGPMDAAQ